VVVVEWQDAVSGWRRLLREAVEVRHSWFLGFDVCWAEEGFWTGYGYGCDCDGSWHVRE